MKTGLRHRALIGCVFLCVLTLLVAGCGGGGSSGGDSPDGAKAANASVLADAGVIVADRVGQTITLNGSASSTTLAAPLTYAWSFSHKPQGSNAVLQNATTAQPSFVADVAGTYMVQLVVTAGGVESTRAIALVEVTPGPDGWFTGRRVHGGPNVSSPYESQCANCHDGHLLNQSPLDPVLTKAGNHMATSNLCQACHTTFGFNLIRFVDHQEVFGNCSTCHNGVTAVGKSQFHVATTAECDNCHTTASFLELGLDGKFDHSNITRACATCHNGTTAIGKHEAHFVTDTDCIACHNTVDFKDAFVDHSAFTSVESCSTCHNGTDAKGQTVGHPAMRVECGVCHGTTSFNMGGVFNHRLVDSSVQPCGDCHNDNNSINARGKASAPTPHVSTTLDCGVCHGVGGGDFASNIFDHSSGQIDVNNCAACHGDAAAGAVTKKHLAHMPTSEDCHVCHTPGTFATGTYDHSGVVDNCSRCHDGVITAGKPVNHIPTTPDDQDCAACHIVKFDDFTGAVFDHAGVTNNCATCHNGTISTGKHANHMPTTRDCSDCHILKFDNFTGGSFDHLNVMTCASCHNGTIAMGKKVNHIPSQTECSQCHEDTTTNGFASPSTFLSGVHPGYVNGCEGCHKAQFFPPTSSVLKPAGHLPTSQDCHFCHTNTAFTPHIFTHRGIFDNCASCHDGNYEAVGALGKTPSPPHPDTTADCGVCHGNFNSFAGGFDHTGVVDNCASCHDGTTAKGKHVGHVPTTQDCSVCHVPGSFATAVFNHTGIVDNCSQCHDGSVATATIKPTNHLPTADDCSACHNTTAFAGARFDHTGVVDNCATCHDGTTAKGKHGNHVPTNDDCSVCHFTTGFKPANFNHAGIVDNCVSCHDGVFAPGKKVGHVDTTADCGLCHNTAAFIPATFDHSNITTSTRCDSCHGVTAIGKDAKTNPAHWATSRDCRDCHTTATFAGGTWLHETSAAGNCKTCHSTSGGATRQPSTAQGHMSTDLQCDACHSTTRWAPTSFSHDPQGNYPGDHRRKPACPDCHGNIITTPFVYPFAQYAPFCAACHANDFDRVDKHNGGKNGTVEQNKDCSGGGRGCHKVTSNEF